MESSGKETSQNPRLVISPTTSTPGTLGLSPELNLRDSSSTILKSSDLLSSEESIVVPEDSELV